MTRLIDADALHDSINKETYRHTYIEQIHSIIDNAPTIDAEPVVRCKDCRKHKTYNCPFGEYDFPGNYMYCYYGERKEE